LELFWQCGMFLELFWQCGMFLELFWQCGMFLELFWQTTVSASRKVAPSGGKAWSFLYTPGTDIYTQIRPICLLEISK
jgi:hypothetical protein